MTTELQKIPGYKVLAWDDVTKMLEHEAGKQQLGCDDDKCISEIGGALGVEFIVAGDIGAVGDRYVMTIRQIDITKAQTLKRVSRKVTGNIGLLLDELPGMVAELFGGSSMQQGASSQATRTGGASDGTQSKDGMVWIEGGSFNMGSNDGESNEKPVHQVTVSGFYMDKTEVTQAEYERVMGNNPSHFKRCPTCPVEQVSWDDAMAYCQKTGKRLPTEAEWEYAARAGSTTKYYWGNGSLDAYAWYSGNSGSKTHAAGQKQPNAWGLYDMSGNVYEWCSDWYNEGYYAKSPSNNPQGAGDGQYRVLHGGSWYDENPELLRSADRRFGEPGYRLNLAGFRCVRSRY
jgi:formylglycine-generating enzyme required for sulfatase activity